MRPVAARLAEAGFNVRREDGDGGSQLDIGCDGERCLAWAADSSHAEWEWRLPAASGTSPKQLADLAAVLLAGADSDLTCQGDGYGSPGITFKGIVGTELAARGLNGILGAYDDQRNYDVTAEVVVTNPASASAGTVFVTDSGTHTWVCGYRDETTASLAPPADCYPDADVVDAAMAISTTVIRAMTRAGLATATQAPGRQRPVVLGHAEPA